MRLCSLEDHQKKNVSEQCQFRDRLVLRFVQPDSFQPKTFPSSRIYDSSSSWGTPLGNADPAAFYQLKCGARYREIYPRSRPHVAGKIGTEDKTDAWLVDITTHLPTITFMIGPAELCT
jgi:hypothetical protein